MSGERGLTRKTGRGERTDKGGLEREKGLSGERGLTKKDWKRRGD